MGVNDTVDTMPGLGTPLTGAPPTPRLFSVGQYSVKSGSDPIKFWPVEPGTKPDMFVASLDLSAFLSPFNLNMLWLPPAVGIFDILIEFTADKLKEEETTEQKMNDLIWKKWSGKPKDFIAPLIRTEGF